MKAIRVHSFGEPEVMRLEVLPEPSPGPGEVLIKVKAVGVNPVDVYIRMGKYAIKPTLPYTPGLDAAGVVESVGDGVTGLKRGDRVYTSCTSFGSYAELMTADHRQVYHMPGRTTFAQGASLGVPYGAAYRALIQKANVQAGESVLVHGATGGVGTAAVQLARARGLVVIGTGGTEEGREQVRRQGAHHVLDHTGEGYMERVMEATGGRGVDVIIELLANVNLGKDLKALAMHGRVVCIGSRGPVELDMRDAMGRDASILGMVLFNATQEELRSIHAGLYAGLEDGYLSPVIGVEMPLSEAPRAHVEIMESRHIGKIILLP